MKNGGKCVISYCPFYFEREGEFLPAFNVFLLALEKVRITDGRDLIKYMIIDMFIKALSFMIIPITSMSSDSMIYMALYFTFSIFIIMSALVYMYPSLFKKTMNFMFPGLLVALIMIILIEVYLIFIKQKYPTNIHRYISYAVVILFSLFISYDTQLMFEEAEICRKYANYPESSMKFILDIINIFVRTLSMQNR